MAFNLYLKFLILCSLGLAIALSRLWYNDSELDSIFSGVYLDSCLSRDDSLKIMSFNIRGDNLDIHSENNNWWKGRNFRAAQIFHKYRPDVAGLQEGSKKQLRDLLDLVSKASGHEYKIVGHSDVSGNWVPNAIIYNATKLTALESGSVWLSATPDVPHSTTWSRLTRSAFWARFVRQDNDVKSSFIVINTHLDHLSEEARQNSARILQKTMQKLRDLFPLDSLFLVGDFNSTPGQPTYNLLVDNENTTDSWHLSQKTNAAPVTFHNWWGHHILAPYGAAATALFMTYWTGGNLPTHWNRYHIDWILQSGNLTSWTPLVSFVITDSLKTTNGNKQFQLYPSDHFPVLTCFKNGDNPN